jgi:nicotinate dehydrogenase subunit B
MNIQISRRDALFASGALVVSFSLAGALEQATAQAVNKPVALTEVDSFLAIDKSGKVTIYSGKVDLGTGVYTALQQIVADELDVPMNRIELIQGDTLLTPDQGRTWASISIQIGGMQLRQAAAAARAALVEDAAKTLGVSDAELAVADGVISGGSKKVSYAELIGGKSFSIKLDPKQPVKEKDPKDYKFVGKSVPRLDIPDKLTGKFTYMQDFRLPGMLHGRVVRPPAIGAKLETVDESSIKDVPGIVKVVRDGDFLGVVASNEWAAIRGARDLKATWSKAETLPDQAKLWDYVRSTKVPAPHFRSGPDKSRITNPLVTGSLLDRFYRYTCEPLSTSRLRRLGPAQRPPFANSRLRHRAYDSVI